MGNLFFLFDCLEVFNFDCDGEGMRGPTKQVDDSLLSGIDSESSNSRIIGRAVSNAKEVAVSTSIERADDEALEGALFLFLRAGS